MAENNDSKETPTDKRTAIIKQVRQIYFDKEEREKVDKKRKMAEYFMELAELEEDGDKMSYIRSIALLNAAVRRMTTEAEKSKVEERIKKVVQNFLHECKAQDKNFNIMKVSSKLKAKLEVRRAEVKEDLKTARKKTSEDLKTLETELVETVKSLLKKVTDLYSKTMEQISSICVATLGIAPCKFSHFAMGSLAREEITMYSDFENAIILDDDAFVENNAIRRHSILEYFGRYAVLFDLLVINLGETPVQLIGIDGLNDHYSRRKADNWFYDLLTPSGIMFDSFLPFASKTPFGRNPTSEKPEGTELILPMSEMLDYLSEDKSVAEGYNLAHMLAESRHVAGDEELFKLYSATSHMKMRRLIKCKEYMQTTFKNVQFDLERFDLTPKFQKLGWKQSAKVSFYRPVSLYVQFLLRTSGVYGITNNFQGTEELAEAYELSDEVRHNLLYGLALANQLRMKVYSVRAQQKEEMAGALHIVEKTEDIATIFDAVGESGALDYYEISLGLRSAISSIVRRMEDDIHEGHVDEMPIKALLEDHLKCRGNLKLYGDIYQQYQSNEKATSWYLKALEKCENRIDKVDILMSLGRTNLVGLKFLDSIDYYKKAIDMAIELHHGEATNLVVVEANTMMGQCYTATRKLWNEFGPCLERADRLCEKLRSADPKNEDYIKALAEIRDTEGFHLTITGHHEESLEKYWMADKLFKQVYGEVKNNDTIKVQNGIAVCLHNLKRYNEAVEMLDKLIFAKTMMIGQRVADVTLARYWRNKGEALVNLKRYEEAIECYRTSRKMRIAVPGPHVEICATMVITTYMLSDCYFRCERFTDALKGAAEVSKLANEIPHTGTGKKYSKLAENMMCSIYAATLRDSQEQAATD